MKVTRSHYSVGCHSVFAHKFAFLTLEFPGVSVKMQIDSWAVVRLRDSISKGSPETYFLSSVHPVGSMQSQPSCLYLGGLPRPHSWELPQGSFLARIPLGNAIPPLLFLFLHKHDGLVSFVPGPGRALQAGSSGPAVGLGTQLCPSLPF